MKKLLALVLGMAVGTVTAVCAGFIQADRTTFNGQTVDYGVPLAVVIVVGMVMWLNRYFQSRLAGVGFSLAWLATTWQLGVETSGGDLALMPVANSHVYLLAGSVFLGIAAAAPVMRPLRNEFFQPNVQPLAHRNDSE